MNITTIFGVLKLALQVYQDERGDAKDRLVKKLNKLESDYYEEMSRPDSERSDLFLIISCSSSTSSVKNLSQNKITESTDIQEPKIPFHPQKAFYPLRMTQNGDIVATYQWRDCVSRFIWCTKWETKKLEFKDLSWFYLNGFGLKKRSEPE